MLLSVTFFPVIFTVDLILSNIVLFLNNPLRADRKNSITLFNSGDILSAILAIFCTALLFVYKVEISARLSPFLNKSKPTLRLSLPFFSNEGIFLILAAPLLNPPTPFPNVLVIP